MGIPQILMIVLLTANVVVALIRHGEVNVDVRRRNAFYDILGVAIVASILYAGGFWSQ
ncbi:MAG: hypothetical protein IKP64_11755 [Selenomonadaceae bacterium]|nr:hypothetical protein [Selenomonadaceae bacterium]MBR4384220.1 hypothetical protein [Selenomonadaceae bacterium]